MLSHNLSPDEISIEDEIDNHFIVEEGFIDLASNNQHFIDSTPANLEDNTTSREATPNAIPENSGTDVSEHVTIPFLNEQLENFINLPNTNNPDDFLHEEAQVFEEIEYNDHYLTDALQASEEYLINEPML